MFRLLFLLVLTINVFWGCRDTPKQAISDTAALLKETADSIFSKNEKGSHVPDPIAYIVLPNAGCGGCISSVERMFADYVRKKYPIKFVLTNINSLKSVKLNFGDSVVENSNVFIDRSSTIYRKIPDLHQIYPIICYNGFGSQKVSFEYVNPDNPEAVEKFKKYVDSVLHVGIL